MKIHNIGHCDLVPTSAAHCMIALAMAALLVNSKPLIAQQAPSVGYIFPAGVAPGTTTDIVLGGYDWTPDLEFFVSDKRVKLEMASSIGDMMVPPPPYWFGPKARGPAMMIPREVSARITVPKELAGKSIRWQVANANGASATGLIVIASGTHTEMTEQEYRTKQVLLSTLPVTLNGQLAKFEEVDEYRIRTTKAGLITCRVSTRAIGSPMQAVLRIHDGAGRLVADAVDTQNLGLNLTFRAETNQSYTLSLHDLDFRGNWSYVYRLHVAPGPRVVAAIPATGKRGTETDVTFVGHGISTGATMLESVTRRIRFPSTSADTFSYQLKTEHGLASPFELGLSDFAELNERDCKGELQKIPTAVTGDFDHRNQSDHYKIALIKGQVLAISATATCDESPLDMTLSIKNDEGNQLATNDDYGGTTNSHITFTVPKDGTYHIIAADLANRGGRLDSTYRLSVLESHPDFKITVPAQASVPLGGKVDLKIAATRLGLFKGDIGIAIEDLPDGVTIAADAKIPDKKKDAKISITADADGSSKAFRATVVARAVINDKTIEHRYPILIARTMKPRAKVTPVDKDGGRTVHRGTTYPAAVIVERLEGFTGPVILQMAAKQGRHRQGIDGNDIQVPPNVTRTVFPVYCPEWLETDRTSRMVVNAITVVTDPTGMKRYLSNKMDGRITMSLEGALLKITGPKGVMAVTPGDTVRISVAVSRSPKLREPVKLELVIAPSQETKFIAAPMTIKPGQTQTTFSIRTPPNMTTPQSLTIRGVAMQDGTYPVVSQTTVQFLAAGKHSNSPNAQEAKPRSSEVPHGHDPTLTKP